MKTLRHRTALVLGMAGAALVAGTALFTPGCSCYPSPDFRESPTRIDSITYHGWTNCYRMTSEAAEVVVVPEIGRVMSFKMQDGKNVFWEDRALDGKRGDATAKEWVNFGGDKTWPSPEGEWGQHTGNKQWMPPSAFDSTPVQGSKVGNQVVLTSPVDPFYGIRTVRKIRLNGSRLTIDTTYERVSGDPSKVGIWVITQFREPVAVYVAAKTNSLFAEARFKFGPEPWPELKREGRLLQITRDPAAPHKMGSDAERLAWVGEKEVCLVTSWRKPNAEYPDRGASAEVYTNPDPKKYVELEMLGPLSLLKSGETISQTSTYTLQKRMQKTPEEELQRLGWSDF